MMSSFMGIYHESTARMEMICAKLHGVAEADWTSVTQRAEDGLSLIESICRVQPANPPRRWWCCRGIRGISEQASSLFDRGCLRISIKMEGAGLLEQTGIATCHA